MKKDLNIEERVCNKKERTEWMRSVGAKQTDEVLAMTESQWQRYKAHVERVLRIGREEPATCGLMVFGRKAPTASELRAQWQEQQKHMEDVREKFTTAVLV